MCESSIWDTILVRCCYKAIATGQIAKDIFGHSICIHPNNYQDAIVEVKRKHMIIDRSLPLDISIGDELIVYIRCSQNG